MVNFFAVGEKNSKKPVYNLVVEKANGHEYYSIATETELEKLPAETEIIKAIKFNSLPEIKRHFFEKHAIIKIPGYPDLLFEPINEYDWINKSFTLGKIGREIKFDGELVVILCQRNLFVQPWDYSLITNQTQFISCFSIQGKNVDQNSFMLKTHPEFKMFALGSDDLSEKLSGPVRIVINCDSPIPVEIKDKYNFVEYTIKDSEEKYLISDPVEDISAQINDSKFFFNNRFLSVIEVVNPAAPVITYDFSTSYCGWYFIVLPFITFIKGLSRVNGKFVSGKLVHLSQSSGYGKTRLCFELLKYEKRGIYCVFRGSSEGYPGTTTWMKSLINAFNGSKTVIESLCICAKFILLSMEIFGAHEIVEGKNFTLDLFEGKRNSIDIEFNLKLESSENFDKLISSIKKKDKKLFSLIFDECHELLITPTDQPYGLSLYRALRRVLYEIKDTGVVAVFLGTKSSLGDFVLNSRKDPSARKSGDDIMNSFNVPVYVFTQGVDVMMNEPFLLSHEEIAKTEMFGTATVRHPTVLKNIMMRCGRPLWSFFNSFEESYNVALHKLKCESSLFELTCLILRTGASIVPQDELAHKLVLSCMATLINVDIEGSSCRVEYVPEPMLSNVARNVLLNIKNYSKAIKEYLKRLQLGSFHETGEAGEFIGRIILLRAMDLALLKPQTGPSNFTEVVALNGKKIFGTENSEYEKNFESHFKSLNHVEADKSHDISDTESPINPSKSYISPTIGVATLREFLVALSNLPSEDFSAFGISDAVLDGFITVNQFVKLENPLKMDQVYLMHGLARSVAFILPNRTPGLDLMIPVLRVDNRMSCVAIQVKKFSSETFPDKVKEVNEKLSRFYLNYLDFGPVGSFDASPVDDFVRIVIQFRESKETEKPIDNFYSWEPIADSESQIDPGNVCKALWLCGLDSFEKSLFFDHEEIIKDLNTILSGQRDFLNVIDFPEIPLPSRLQTTEEGARFLVSCARPLGKRSNLIAGDVSLQTNGDSSYEVYMKKLEMLDIPKFAKDYHNSLTFTSKKEVVDHIKAKSQTVFEKNLKKYEKDAKTIISACERKNSEYEAKNDLVEEKKKYNDDFKEICKSEREEHSEQVKIRKLTLQAEREQLLERRKGCQLTVLESKTQSAGQKRRASQMSTTSENNAQNLRTSQRAAKKKSKN